MNLTQTYVYIDHNQYVSFSGHYFKIRYWEINVCISVHDT